MIVTKVNNFGVMTLTIQLKIKNAIYNNKLKLLEGERNWYQYFVTIQELVWARNNHDGYLINVYDEKHGRHLCKVIV